MNLKATQRSSGLDIFIWIVIALLVGVAIVSNFYFGDYPFAVRFIGLILLAAIVLGLALQTNAGGSAWEFVKQARMELRKVVWPTRQETVQTTLVVVGMVVVTSLVLWGIDSVLLWGIGFISGHTG